MSEKCFFWEIRRGATTLDGGFSEYFTIALNKVLSSKHHGARYVISDEVNDGVIAQGIVPDVRVLTKITKPNLDDT